MSTMALVTLNSNEETVGGLTGWKGTPAEDTLSVKRIVPGIPFTCTIPSDISKLSLT